MNITICGGGNLGHVTAGFLASQDGLHISLLTTKPALWSHEIRIIDVKGNTFNGKIEKISSFPMDVIPNADIVLVCLPGYAIHNVLNRIVPYLNAKTWVGTVVSSTGFFFEAFEILPKTQPLFGFQRVPFISRVIDYGHVAELKGYKDSLYVAVEQTEEKEVIRAVLENLFKTPTHLLDSYYEVSLSNSNPLLHTARLYTLWKDWKPGVSYQHNPFFYADWTIEASELYIKMDEEFQSLLKVIGVKENSIPTVLDYYESHDAPTLTSKIRSISAFQGILSPMTINTNDVYVPDFTSRYFTEDFPYGMKFIVETARKYNEEVPAITRVYCWGMGKIEKI